MPLQACRAMAWGPSGLEANRDVGVWNRTQKGVKSLTERFPCVSGLPASSSGIGTKAYKQSAESSMLRFIHQGGKEGWTHDEAWLVIWLVWAGVRMGIDATPFKAGAGQTIFDNGLKDIQSTPRFQIIEAIFRVPSFYWNQRDVVRYSAGSAFASLVGKETTWEPGCVVWKPFLAFNWIFLDNHVS